MFSVPFFTFNPLLISSPDYRWLTRTPIPNLTTDISQDMSLAKTLSAAFAFLAKTGT